MPEVDDELGEFRAFDEVAPLFGYMHRQYGEGDLRELLKLYADSPKANREFLEDAARELQQVGLVKPATILLEVAADLPSGIDLNPYNGEEGSHNWWSWRRSWALHRQEITGESWGKMLRRYGLDKQKH